MRIPDGNFRRQFSYLGWRLAEPPRDADNVVAAREHRRAIEEERERRRASAPDDAQKRPRLCGDSPVALRRVASGLTQTQLAHLVGCRPQAISRWELGQSVPRADTVRGVARALGCSMEDLLG